MYMYIHVLLLLRKDINYVTHTISLIECIPLNISQEHTYHYYLFGYCYTYCIQRIRVGMCVEIICCIICVCMHIMFIYTCPIVAKKRHQLRSPHHLFNCVYTTEHSTGVYICIILLAFIIIWILLHCIQRIRVGMCVEINSSIEFQRLQTLGSAYIKALWQLTKC